MTAPAIAPPTLTVTIGGGNHFHVFHEGRRVGEMWRYGDGETTVWRAYRDGHGASLDAFPTQEKAAAAVGWDVQIPAAQLPYRAKGVTYGVTLRSPDGDAMRIILAETDHERQTVLCTAVVDSPAYRDMVAGDDDTSGASLAAAAVRARVFQQFGVRCLGGGARGSSGAPVVLFTAPADHKLTLHP